MKNILLVLSTVIIFNSYAQEFPIEVQPPSWRISNLTSDLPYMLPQFDVQTLLDEDAEYDSNALKPWRFGKELPVNHNFLNHGEWTTLENGDKIWRISYKSEGALTLNFMFSEFYIPEGSKVYVYNNDRSDLLRPFTHHNNHPDEVLGTWLVQGDYAWIEYFQPAQITEQAKITIGGVVHGYRSAASYQLKDINDGASCHYDVDCDITPQNDIYQINQRKEEIKRSTAMLLVGGSGFCSGTLINNTNNDGTPYILTANHCGGGESSWAFRFNWRSPNPSCGTLDLSANGSFNQTVSGSILRANSSQSDMELVEITDTSFFSNNPNVVWAGWNRSTTDVPPVSFGVHHAAADIQKVTRYDVPGIRTEIDFLGDPDTQMWYLSDYGLGYIEPGSSGSSLFNQNGHVIGVAAAASFSCSGTSPSGEVFYGRFGVAWDFGSNSSSRLQDWLDPGNAGIDVLDIFPPLIIYDVDARVTAGNNAIELCDADFQPNITIINQGIFTLNSAQVTYFLDDELPTTINWTGSLLQNESEVIANPVYSNLSEGIHTFNISVSNPNGNTDENTFNDNFVSNFEVSPTFDTNNIILDITTDDFGEETSWELYDISSNTNVLVANGPSSSYVSNTDYQETISLPSPENCYEFVLLDSFGDGICCGFGNGSYVLTDDNGNIMVSGGSFQSSERIAFKTAATFSISDNILENSIRLFPNPVENKLNIQFTSSIDQELSYVIYNIAGQSLLKAKLNSSKLNEIDLSSLHSGTYIINIQSNSGYLSYQIIKK